MTEPELLFDGRAELAEGPVWHHNALWWVEITAGRLNRLSIGTGIAESRALGSTIGCAAPTDAPHTWLIATQNGLELLDWESGDRHPVAPLEKDLPGNRPNDGKCDPYGRFWVGTMNRHGEKEKGALYRLDPDGRIERILDAVTLANGLAWAPDGSRFYFIDTTTRRIDRFDYDPDSGGISGRIPLRRFEAGEGAPDGMAIDRSGNLWVALWGGSAVLGIDGQSGRTLDRIPMPVSQPTSCCFGGEGGRTLFITTAWQGMDAARREAEPHAGGIFHCVPGVSGSPAAAYRLHDSIFH